jgi:cytoskeleton protein RodZ
MQTKKIGQILQEERQARGLTLQEVSETTKIKLQHLKALEKNQFDRLPASPFVKGFIRSYARVLDLDVKPLLALLRRDYKEDQFGRFLSREFMRPVMKKQNFWRPVTFVVIGAATVFLMLLAYVGWQWYSLNRPPELEIFTPEDNQFVSAQIEVAGRTQPEAMVMVNAQPVALQPDGSFRTEVFLPKEGITTLTVEAIDQRGKSSLKQRTVYVKF